mmetsp:Transcript_82754/g.192293  ORF Transcript_82754/g.192293 Transcript_82754/m.192293 type:complete len:319 (+) Transcript_82754:359-1315(+)
MRTTTKSRSFCDEKVRGMSLRHRMRMREVRTMRASLTTRSSFKDRTSWAFCKTSEEDAIAVSIISKGMMLTKSSKNQDFKYLQRKSTGSRSTMWPPLCGLSTSTLRKNCKTMSVKNSTSIVRLRITKPRRVLSMCSKNTTSKGVMIAMIASPTAIDKSQNLMKGLCGLTRQFSGCRASLMSSTRWWAERSFHCLSGYFCTQSSWKTMSLGSNGFVKPLLRFRPRSMAPTFAGCLVTGGGLASSCAPSSSASSQTVSRGGGVVSTKCLAGEVDTTAFMTSSSGSVFDFAVTGCTATDGFASKGSSRSTPASCNARSSRS